MLTQQKHGTLNWWSTVTCDACWLVLTAAAERASISLAVAFRAARPPTVLPAAADTRRLTASRLDTSSDISRAYSPASSAHARSHCDIQQSSNGPLSGTTRVSRYQNSVCPSVCLSVWGRWKCENGNERLENAGPLCFAEWIFVKFCKESRRSVPNTGPRILVLIVPGVPPGEPKMYKCTTSCQCCTDDELFDYSGPFKGPL